MTLENTEITSNSLNTTINITAFSITFDQLDVLDNAITFTNLRYTNPLAHGETRIGLLNYTLPNRSLTDSDFPYIIASSNNDRKSIYNNLGIGVFASMVFKVKSCHIERIIYGGTIYGNNFYSCTAGGGRLSINIAPFSSEFQIIYIDSGNPQQYQKKQQNLLGDNKNTGEGGLIFSGDFDSNIILPKFLFILLFLVGLVIFIFIFQKLTRRRDKPKPIILKKEKPSDSSDLIDSQNFPKSL